MDVNLSADDKGSVIVSKFEPTVFNVSTLFTPKNFEHPLSGTRQWGVENPASDPNTTMFYTQGVDRIRSLGTVFINWITNVGWDAADNLWKDMQDHMVYFINTNGGSATLYNPRSINAQPNWSEFSEVVSGKITIAEYKIKIGCP